MIAWSLLVVAIALAACSLALLFVPWRVRLNVRGRGEPSGAWAAAGGAQLGPVAVSAVAANGVPLRTQLLLWGKPRPLPERTKRARKPKKKPEGTLSERAQSGYARLERWFDPFELVWFVAHERRRVRLSQLDVELDYSFEDVALTGKLQGALYVLSGMFPGKLRVVQHVSWESVDRAEGALRGEITVWPGLVLLDGAWFVLRRIKLRKRNDSAARDEPT